MKAQLEFALLKDNNLSTNEQHQLVTFLLVFNVFEARLFKDGRGVSNLLISICNDLVNEQWFCISDFQDYIDFFKNRYVKDENKFHQLQLTGKIDDLSTDKGNAKAVLYGEEASNEKVLRCCFCIAYRFRNNLFHGNKDVLGLNAYCDCFNKIMNFIVLLMEKMIDNKFDGLQTKY